MTDLVKISGVGPAFARTCTAAGFGTAEKLAAAKAADVAAVPGIGEKRAQSLINAAQELLHISSSPAVTDTPTAVDKPTKDEKKVANKGGGKKVSKKEKKDKKGKKKANKKGKGKKASKKGKKK